MKKEYRVPATTFVVVWESCQTVVEAAAKMMMSARAAGARASRYRGRGIRLRKLKRSPPVSRLDVAALNALADGAAGRRASR
jgi:hypothetical protein